MEKMGDEGIAAVARGGSEGDETTQSLPDTRPAGALSDFAMGQRNT